MLCYVGLRASVSITNNFWTFLLSQLFPPFPHPYLSLSLFLSHFQEVSAQLRALLQPTTLATVQLFHRLVSIVQDLDVLMRALSADNEVVTLEMSVSCCHFFRN